MTHEEFTAKHPHPPSHVYVKIDRHSDPVIDQHQETAINRQHPAPSDRRAPITYRVQMPKIDFAPEYETEYSVSIETLTATSIDSAQQKLTDRAKEESVDINQGEWENDYYNPTMEAHNMHTKENGSTSIDTQPHQPSHIRASTDIAYYSSIDTNVDATRDGDYSIRSWADDRHRESYAVETAYHDQGADELHEGFTYEELLNVAIPPSIDINPSTSIDINHTTSIDSRPKAKTTVSEKDKSDNQYLTPDEFGIFREDGYAKAIDGRTQHVSREDIADMQQRTITEHRQKVTKEFYETTGGIDKRFKHRSRHPIRPSIDVDVPTSVDRHPEFGRRAFDLFDTRKFYWEEKDEYGNYIDDQGYARDVDGHTIHVHNKDIRRLVERASRDDPNYICLPEHATSFTQIKLVPEIYTKDEINEMFYGICGEQEKNKEYFQMKLDGVYYPLNDSISWLTTCIHRHASIDSRLHASIDNRFPASVDDNPPHSHTMKSQPDFHTRREIDQLVDGIYRALETTEERLDRRCDDIYFPMDLSISALSFRIEAIQGELVEIQSYNARRLEASASIDRRNNKSTNTHRQTSVDDATNRGRPVQKVTSDMFDTHNHGEEISADTYATIMRHRFNLESLGDRLQKIEDATTIMKDKWRRGDEAMRDFTGT
ncbi:hypothetical protein DY000_02009821 [Brassica cretica]|uniref:Uncharacterized protein n=1 Tax=Brassica cretica TaxID=69181 RepID=A0ABQ7CKP6_BRACR|nr:hypothetical protein DY000_02009821 [Brassica cretica]